MSVCGFCGAKVISLGHHYGGHECAPCPAVARAFDGRDITDPARSDRQTAARYGYASSSPCARCGGGPRVARVPYCRKCKRLVCAESAARVRERGRA